MKNYIKVAIVLGAIALVCSLVIALVNIATSETIRQNNIQTELNTCKQIFATYDDESSTKLTDDKLKDKNSAITKIIYAKDKSGNDLGTLYTVSGKNAYGTITLMVAITDGKVKQVEFLENSQSFAQTVNNHLLSNYPSSESTDVHLGAYSKADGGNVGALDSGALDGVDVKCGATYGATLIKELVKIALESEVA